MDLFLIISSIFLKDYLVFSIVLFGIIFINRDLFLRVAVLCLSGIVLNVVLKNIFQVPLNPLLNKDWYAFPSGHIQLATVFYGYLLYVYKAEHLLTRLAVWTLFLAYLILESTFLLHFGYHTYLDIIGGIIAGVLWIIVFERLMNIRFFQHEFKRLIVFLTGISYFVYLLPKIPSTYSLVPIALSVLTIYAFLFQRKC